MVMKVAMRPSRTRCIPLCLYISTCKCLLQHVIGFDRGFCLHNTFHVGAPLGLSLDIPASALCCGAPSALILQIRSHHVFHERWSGSWGRSSHILASCRVVLSDEKWEDLSHAHYFGSISPTPELTGLDLFCCPG